MEEYPRCSNCRKNNLRVKRCSSCKIVFYCSKKCQKNDWNIHKIECENIFTENSLASALSAEYPGISDGDSLRRVMIEIKSLKEPFLYVLRELKSFLVGSSLKHWDPDNSGGNRLAVIRMDALIEAAESSDEDIDWLRVSSTAYGSVMVHNVINSKAKNEYKFRQNPWFESYLYNFGRVLDSIKLWAILSENKLQGFLNTSDFPFIPMLSPSRSGSEYRFFRTRLRLNSEGKVCFVCKKRLSPGRVLSPYDPDRSSELPRHLNFLPPREYTLAGVKRSSKILSHWTTSVLRTKTIPKDYVCGWDCEQDALYGRFFSNHPLEPSKSEEMDKENRNPFDEDD